MKAPTAQMSVAEMPEMPSRKLSVGWVLLSMMFGLTTCTQPVPSKCSIRVCKTGGLGTVSVVNPTAQILVGDKVRRPLLASALSLLPGLGVEIVLNVELQAGKACGATERRGFDAGSVTPLARRCGIDRGQSSCVLGFAVAAGLRFAAAAGATGIVDARTAKASAGRNRMLRTIEPSSTGDAPAPSQHIHFSQTTDNRLRSRCADYCTGRGSGKGSACSSSCAAQSSGGDLLEAFPRSRVCGNASE